VTPESFTFIESAIILAIVVLGGMGSQLGVILAAIVMILLPELMREFSEYRMLMFGALMVLMMIWRPQACCPCNVHTWSCAMSREILQVSGLSMRFGGLLAVNGVA
jgi:ABC-type branched-subunit amino acid transport system permease subunit